MKINKTLLLQLIRFKIYNHNKPILNLFNFIKNKLTNIAYIKPPIKWIGGKTQIIEKIISRLPNEINNYHELFLGGGSVLLALLQNIENNRIIVYNNIYAYDINEPLISLYKNIQKYPKDIIKEITKIIDVYNSIKNIDIIRKPKNLEEALTSQESYYYWIRKEFNNLTKEQKNSILGTAYFIFLNKTCFRGMYREGPNGYNVPFGNYANPEIINEAHIFKISKLIKNVNFIHSTFENSFNNIKENDFIYLDPPYAPENLKSFVGYTKNGFNLEQHKLLFEKCKNHKFLMSNADVDLVKESFKDKKYIIKIILCKRAINSKNPESKTNEVLITSFNI